MLTIHRSGSPLGVVPHAISWHWIPPVTIDERGSQHRSCGAGGSHRRRELGVVAQHPHLPLPGDREAVGTQGEAHGVVEPAEGEGELLVGDPDGDHLAGLVGRDQQRATRLLEEPGEAGAVVEPDLGRAAVGRRSRLVRIRLVRSRHRFFTV